MTPVNVGLLILNLLLHLLQRCLGLLQGWQPIRYVGDSRPAGDFGFRQ
jgi:hypothetical protein